MGSGSPIFFVLWGLRPFVRSFVRPLVRSSVRPAIFKKLFLNFLPVKKAGQCHDDDHNDKNDDHESLTTTTKDSDNANPEMTFR